MEQKEIEKMSSENLLEELIDAISYIKSAPGKVGVDFYTSNYNEIRLELLKRLSKNSVEDYKKRLVEEIKKIDTEEDYNSTSSRDLCGLRQRIIKIINKTI